jgi:hypothetical protein
MKKQPLVAIKFSSLDDRTSLQYVLDLLGISLENFVNRAVMEKLASMNTIAERLAKEAESSETNYDVAANP